MSRMVCRAWDTILSNEMTHRTRPYCGKWERKDTERDVKTLTLLDNWAYEWHSVRSGIVVGLHGPSVFTENVAMEGMWMLMETVIAEPDEMKAKTQPHIALYGMGERQRSWAGKKRVHEQRIEHNETIPMWALGTIWKQLESGGIAQ